METFGKEVVGEDGTINRRVLGSIVFSDPGRVHRKLSRCRKDEATHRHFVASHP